MVRDLWRWAREVATEQELGAPPALRIDDDGFVVDILDATGEPVQARIPVSKRPNPSPHPILKEIHACEVAGRALESHDMESLRDRAAAALEAIAPGGRLPLLWFRAPATGYEVAVHCEEAELVCPLVGGRRVKARTLARLRSQVTRHLVSGGQLHEDDELDVCVLRADELHRAAPAAVLRSGDTWLPVIADGDELRTLDPVQGEPLVGDDLMALVRTARHRLGDEGLHATDVAREVWTDAAQHTTPSGRRISAQPGDDHPPLELEVRQCPAGDVAAAVDDDGIHVFVAPDADALAALVAAQLHASGFVAGAGAVSAG